MTARRSALYALLITHFSFAAETPAPTEEREQKTSPTVLYSVNRAINEWENATSITVSPQAKKQIGFELSALATKGVPAESTPHVAAAYLYELRDFKGTAGTYPAILDLRDTKHYSLHSFARKAVLGRAVGYLKLSSIPLGGEIKINGEVKGNTEKQFVLSTGRHSIVISLKQRTCEREVLIEEQKLAEFTCRDHK